MILHRNISKLQGYLKHVKLKLDSYVSSSNPATNLVQIDGLRIQEKIMDRRVAP